MGKSLSPRLPTKLDTDYSAAAGRLWTSLDTVRISQPVISLSLDSLKNTCLTSDLEDTTLWSNPSPFGYKIPTNFSSSLGYKTWCHGGNNVRMSLVTVEVWCVPCAKYTSMSEFIARHQTVCLTYWTPLCLPYVIIYKSIQGQLMWTYIWKLATTHFSLW